MWIGRSFVPRAKSPHWQSEEVSELWLSHLMINLISVQAARITIRLLPLEQLSITHLVSPNILIRHNCFYQAGKWTNCAIHIPHCWILISLLLSSAATWKVKIPAALYTCLAETFKDLRAKKKRRRPDVRRESLASNSYTIGSNICNTFHQEPKPLLQMGKQTLDISLT